MTLDLEAIKRRAEAATEGPWEWTDDCFLWNRELDVGVLNHESNWPVSPENRAFLAHARTDIPALCDEVERLRGEVERQDGYLETANRSILELSETINQERSELAKALERVARLEARNTNNETEISTLNLAITDTHHDAEEYRVQLDAMTHHHDVAYTAMKDAITDRDRLRTENHDLRTQLQTLTSERDAARAQLDAARAERDRLHLVMHQCAENAADRIAAYVKLHVGGDDEYSWLVDGILGGAWRPTPTAARGEE